MTHRLLIETGLPTPGETLVVVGPEAHHAARVKRVEPGQSLALGDGHGGEAMGRVTAIEKRGRGDWSMAVVIDRAWTTPPVRPWIEVGSGVPKGPRLELLIDQLSQSGAGAWWPLVVERSVVDPRPGKLGRLPRVAIEAAKQCWRPWLLEIGEGRDLHAALTDGTGGGRRTVLADPSGGAYVPDGSERIRLLIGPEGGWSDRELHAAREAGASVMSIGPHVMRIEAAAPIAVALILDAERARSGRQWTHSTEHEPCGQ